MRHEGTEGKRESRPAQPYPPFRSMDPPRLIDKRAEGFRLNTMITLTESARKAISQLAEKRAEPGQVMRMFITSGGCSGLEYGMAFAEAKEDDVKMTSEGVDFYVDKKSLARLDGSEVDFDDGLTGKGFEIRNPNAQATCGCGKSYGV